MIVHVYKTDVEQVVSQTETIYAQLPLVPFSVYDLDYDADYEQETNHLVSLEIDKERAKVEGFYGGGYYPFYRPRDLALFTQLCQNDTRETKEE